MGEVVALLSDQLLKDASSCLARDMAGHVGDRIHEILRDQACLMPTTSLAACTGILAARQILEETILFGRNSMPGLEAEMEAALRKLFEELRHAD